MCLLSQALLAALFTCCTVHVLSHLVLTATLQYRCCHDSHFPKEESRGIEKTNNFPRSADCKSIILSTTHSFICFSGGQYISVDLSKAFPFVPEELF